jgi:hypothetical protein
MMNFSPHPLRLVLAASFILACSDSGAPTPSLVDSWALVSFTDHGTVGATTGTVEFRPDGSFEVVGTVTYPGEPTDSLHVSGVYAVHGPTISLTVGGTTDDWDLFWTGQQFILTLRGPAPTNRMILAPLP